MKWLLYGFNRRKQYICVLFVFIKENVYYLYLLKKIVYAWRRLEMLQTAVSWGQKISDRIILSTFLCFNFFSGCLILTNLKAVTWRGRDSHGTAPTWSFHTSTSVRLLACGRGNYCPRRQASQEWSQLLEGGSWEHVYGDHIIPSPLCLFSAFWWEVALPPNSVTMRLCPSKTPNDHTPDLLQLRATPIFPPLLGPRI